jgi:hypothetical protein
MTAMKATSRSLPLAWYLRSFSDHDTHCGPMGDDGIVLVPCGVAFTPKPTLQVEGPPPGRLVDAGPALKGNPPDPEQICQKCQQIYRST